MAKLSELQPQDAIELQGNGGGSRNPQGRDEDSDSFALRQAGKTPVLRVRRSHLLILFYVS